MTDSCFTERLAAYYGNIIILHWLIIVRTDITYSTYPLVLINAKLFLI